MLIESLEHRQLLAFSAFIDFSTPSAPTVSGFVKDIGSTYGSRNGLTYGWNTSNTSAARQRGVLGGSVANRDTLTHTQLYGSRTWEIAVPNGTYSVLLAAGDPSYTDSNYRFNAEGTLVLSGVPTSSNRFIDQVSTVTVTDGRLTISNASGSRNNKLAYIQINQLGSTPTPTPTPTPTGQSPYGGLAQNLPGRLQAENFDEGGQGVSYSDKDSSNRGGRYRSTGVDLFAGENGNGVALGATQAGEWTEYTVNVASSGSYDFAFRVASNSQGGTFHVNVDGSNKTGSITLPSTGDWNKYTTVTKSGVYLSAGTHVLRLSLDSARSYGTDIGNIDYVDIARQGETPSPTPTPTPTPTGSLWPSSWQSSTSSPINRFENYGFSYGGKLYTMGGFDDNTFDGVTRMDVFDPSTKKWSYLGEMKAPPTHAGLAVDTGNGYAYFVDGYRNIYPNTPTKEVWRYDIKGNSWQRLPDYPLTGGAGEAALVNGELHFFGGSKADRVTNTGQHYALDLSNTSAGWKKKADQPSSRDHMSAVVYNGAIYAVGGEFGHDRDSNHQKILQKYDPNTDKWTRLADAPIAKSHAESSTFVHNGKLIWAGGQTFPKDAGTSNVVAYDFASNKWSYLKSLPAPRQGVTVQVVGDVVVIANGGQYTTKPQKTTWIGQL